MNQVYVWVDLAKIVQCQNEAVIVCEFSELSMTTQGLDVVGNRTVDIVSDWLIFACTTGILSSVCVL